MKENEKLKELIINSYIEKYRQDADIDNNGRVDKLLDIAIRTIIKQEVGKELLK